MSYGSSIKVTPEEFLKTIDLVLAALEDVPSADELLGTEGTRELAQGVASGFTIEVVRSASAFKAVGQVFTDELQELRKKLIDTLADFVEQEVIAGDEAKNLLSLLAVSDAETISAVAPARTPSSQPTLKDFQ